MNIDKSKLGAPLLVSAVTGTMAVGALLTGGYVLASTLIASFGAEVDSEQMVAAWVERHEERMDLYTTRFNGRSVFYTPTKTPPPPPPPAPVVQRETTPTPPPPVDAGPPPAPQVYGGPPLLAILGEEVWIRGTGSATAIVRVKVGEERDGVRLIATDPPWSAELGWSRGEYTVPLFSNSVPGITEEAPSAITASIPGILNEGTVDPATLTSGISISTAAFSPPSAAGRNVARPANAVTGSIPESGGGSRRMTRDQRNAVRQKEQAAEQAAAEKQRQYAESQREQEQDRRRNDT